jgi:hypothetical protein
VQNHHKEKALEMNGKIPAEQKKPGRKAETPQQRLERLERDLVLARKAVTDAKQRQLATIGQAVIDEANENAEFKKQLYLMLQARVTSKAGKVEIASLMRDNSASPQ